MVPSRLPVKQKISYGPPASLIWPRHFPSIMWMSVIALPVTFEAPRSRPAASSSAAVRLGSGGVAIRPPCRAADEANLEQDSSRDTCSCGIGLLVGQPPSLGDDVMEIKARDRRPRPDGVDVDYPLGPVPRSRAPERPSGNRSRRHPPDVPAIVPRSCQRSRDRSNRRALALRGIDGWRKIATVSRQHTTLAAALAFAFLTAPVAAGAQPPGKVYLIGILADRAADANEILAWQIFRAGLREQGWKEGVNIRIESRWIEGNVDRLPEMAADLVRLKPDLIATRGSF